MDVPYDSTDTFGNISLNSLHFEFVTNGNISLNSLQMHDMFVNIDANSGSEFRLPQRISSLLSGQSSIPSQRNLKSIHFELSLHRNCSKLQCKPPIIIVFPRYNKILYNQLQKTSTRKKCQNFLTNQNVKCASLKCGFLKISLQIIAGKQR